MSIQQSFITLSDGNVIPQLGLGVWQATQEQAANAVSEAIKSGYRHVDTASVYENEDGVGIGIKQSGIAREEVFVTTKVWETEQGYEPTLRAFGQSQQKLGLEFVDLYLIHWPVAGHRKDTWQALERLNRVSDAELAARGLTRDGEIRRIMGVSGF